jgi:hypothetical protein
MVVYRARAMVGDLVLSYFPADGAELELKVPKAWPHIPAPALPC